MVGKATARYIRISPRKVRQVLDLIRGKSCVKALAELDHANKRAATHVGKLLRSAIRNVEQKDGHGPDRLFISKATADKGPTLKRFRARAMGRASAILKRMSHIYVELDLLPEPKVAPGAEKPKGRLGAIKQKIKEKKAVTAKARIVPNMIRVRFMRHLLSV